MSGTLFICATPIGNLEDMTFRAVSTLKTVNVIAAEDTRHTLKLLNYFEIKTPLTSYHEHNKRDKGAKILERLLSGENIALVSDAGMPAISDPGYELVCLCAENGINITVIPGCTASVCALVVSGLPTRRFVFEGFLPANKKERQQVLSALQHETRTVILYEAPHKLKSTLNELLDFFGDRKISCVRELTKKYEDIKRTTLLELINFYEQNEPKGEFVLIIDGAAKQEATDVNELTVLEHMRLYLEAGMSEKEAMKAVAKERGVGKSVVYSELLKYKEIERECQQTANLKGSGL